MHNQRAMNQRENRFSMDEVMAKAEPWDLDDEGYNQIDECHSPTLPYLNTSNTLLFFINFHLQKLVIYQAKRDQFIVHLKTFRTEFLKHIKKTN